MSFLQPSQPPRGTTASEPPVSFTIHDSESTPDEVSRRIGEAIIQGTLALQANGGVSTMLQNLILASVKNGELCKPPSGSRLNAKCNQEIGSVVRPEYILEISEELADPNARWTRTAKTVEKRAGSLVQSHLVILARNENSVFGFVTLYAERDYLYIDVLCSTPNAKLGWPLIRAVAHVAQVLGFETIQLRALDYVWGTAEQCARNEARGLVGYYERLGFARIPGDNGLDPSVDGVPMAASARDILISV